jgi:hypothetical protein
LTIDIALSAVAGVTTPSASVSASPRALSAAPPKQDHTRSSDASGLAPWIAAGATVVLAATAAGFGLAGNAELDELQKRCGQDCSKDEREALWNDSPIETYETLTNAALIAAAAGAITTVTLLLVLDDDDPTDHARARSPRARALGLRVTSRF